VSCGERLALLLGVEPPIVAVTYEPPKAERDSGYFVLFSDHEQVVDIEDPRSRPYCVSCLIDEHPEVGRGLDIAREHGVAELDQTAGWRAVS
jgi:hypothetical protein